LRLCATPHPKPAGAGAPARIAPAAQARSVRPPFAHACLLHSPTSPCRSYGSDLAGCGRDRCCHYRDPSRDAQKSLALGRGSRWHWRHVHRPEDCCDRAINSTPRTERSRCTCWSASSSRSMRRRPNKRLKLAGGDRSKGSGVLCPGGHELSFNYTARVGRVARSLSAIR